MNKSLKILLESQAIKAILSDSEDNYVFKQIDKTVSTEINIESQVRLAYILINDIYSKNEPDKTLDITLINKAYLLLKSIDINDPSVENACAETFGIDGIRTDLLYYFYLASFALKADKIINVRIDLQDFIESEPQQYSDDWKIRLVNKSLEAFILLTRKSNGFSDIRKAILIIEKLRSEQEEFENTYLSILNKSLEVKEACILLGLYHLSKTIVETGLFLIEGYSYKDNVSTIIRQHCDAARKLFSDEERLQGLTDIMEDNLKVHVINSIWAKTSFNDKIQKLCKFKSENGIIELLPSQREALNQKLLDVAANVTVVQMPTSAGKTLLAEFNIIITKALKQDSKIIYVVPSRALVNQVYHDLRMDLEPLDIIIEKTSSAIDLDPNEDVLLKDDKIDVLISTPEKLDLLIRRNHKSVEDVSLFIIDEAHSIQNGERGAKLELLLAILKRERSNAKFMLLSPFIRKAGDTISEWLGGGNSIAIDWKPSEKILFGLDLHKTKKIDDVKYTILPSAYDHYLSSSTSSVFETKVTRNRYELETKPSRKKDRILEYTVKQFGKEGKTVLVLCEGKKTADKRASFIYGCVDNESSSEDIDLVRKFVDYEIGRPTTLSKVLEKRIAIHHAGLSDETKLLVEHLIRQKEIKYVCSTTTVAEGVNFPVSTVFFDSYDKGSEPLNNNDFWNIAGRAGRTLVDNFGKIIMPFNSDNNINRAKSLIKEGANELISVLSELFINGDEIISHLNEKKELSGLIGQYYNSLGPLIQYFVHLITVSNDSSYSIQVEDLFKDSLEYYLLDTLEKKEKFIAICKAIYEFLQNRYADQKNILSFADKTGFSVPSVLSVMSAKSKLKHISDLDSWRPESLFNNKNPDNLGEKIRVIADLRETRMGTDADQSAFNPKIIAQILIKWVQGEKLSDMTSLHPYYNSFIDENEQMNEFIKKVNDLRFKASWGLSALEGIVKGNSETIKDSFIPSYIYYGVDNEKSLMLRMVGIPRSLSFSMTDILGEDSSKYSYRSLRTRINSLSSYDWDNLKPKGSSLNGEEWKRVTSILMNK